MKTQCSQKLQINKYHLKDHNNKINHHSRERGLFLSPLEMFAFCVTEEASGSCLGVSLSWFWTRELHVCLLSGLCATGHVFFSCWVWLNAWWNLPGGHVCAEGLDPQEQASGDLCLFRGRTEQVRALSGLFSSLFSSTLNSQATGNREKGREPQKMTSGKVIFYIIYIYV